MWGSGRGRVSPLWDCGRPTCFFRKGRLRRMRGALKVTLNIGAGSNIRGPIPRTHKCWSMRSKGLCRCHYTKDLRWAGGPSTQADTKCSHRGPSRRDTEETGLWKRKPSDNRSKMVHFWPGDGRGQGPSNTGLEVGKGQGADSYPEQPAEPKPETPWEVEVTPHTLTQWANACVVKPPSLWRFVTEAEESHTTCNHLDPWVLCWSRGQGLPHSCGTQLSQHRNS